MRSRRVGKPGFSRQPETLGRLRLDDVTAREHQGVDRRLEHVDERVDRARLARHRDRPPQKSRLSRLVPHRRSSRRRPAE